jgi:hypothetical protein
MALLIMAASGETSSELIEVELIGRRTKIFTFLNWS